jgi:hypothetical protein
MPLDLAAVFFRRLGIVGDLAQEPLDVRTIAGEVLSDGGGEQLIDGHHPLVQQRGDVVDRGPVLAA